MKKARYCIITAGVFTLMSTFGYSEESHAVKESNSVETEISRIKTDIADYKKSDPDGRVYSQEISDLHTKKIHLERKQKHESCDQLKAEEQKLRALLEEINTELPALDPPEEGLTIEETRSQQGRLRAEALNNHRKNLSAVTAKIEKIQTRWLELNCQ